nr:hypothetical protein [Mycoplasmopsis bovis]
MISLRILSKNEALEKAKEIIKHYQNNFGWEFKSDESREDEDE